MTQRMKIAVIQTGKVVNKVIVTGAIIGTLFLLGSIIYFTITIQYQ